MESKEEKTLNERTRRNDWFLKSFDTLIGEQKAVFQGLDFYPYNSKYLNVCELQVFKNIEKAVFVVEGYGQIELRKYGYVNTEINGQNITLHFYCDLQAESPTEVFAPFKDKTNGKTTYGGGRNLNVQIADGKAVIDFNDATNMECAYTAESVCAVPLPENWLGVSIEAGEKVFQQKSI